MCVLNLRTHSWRHYLQKRHYSFGGKNMWIHCRTHMYHIVKVSSFQTRKKIQFNKHDISNKNGAFEMIKFIHRIWKKNFFTFQGCVQKWEEGVCFEHLTFLTVSSLNPFLGPLAVLFFCNWLQSSWQERIILLSMNQVESCSSRKYMWMFLKNFRLY